MRRRTPKDYALLVLKGIGMGAADVIPGVSGGTIAFIVGIYGELIDSIKHIGSADTLRLLLTLRIGAFWRAANGNFLLSIIAGIGISIFSLARLVTYLLTHQPVLVWAFFFGLVLASTWFVSREVTRWNAKSLLGFVVGAAAAWFITVMTPAETPTGLWFIFVCGAIAICAMILPGISGSFILVLLGKYFYIMEAVKSLNLPVLIVFVCGAAIGITLFSHALSYALHRFHNVTIALLSGFMLGSLNKVWPWKEAIETYIDSHGQVRALVERNILPDQLLWQAIALAVAGFALVCVLELTAGRKTKNEIINP